VKRFNLKTYDGPPYIYKVRVKGKNEIKRMIGFDEEHIKEQLKPKKLTYCKKVKEGGKDE
tara:strand:+ start:13779 stop:13958 length:180 start_codon:yes stop_codon:yes gene_type:complete